MADDLNTEIKIGADASGVEAGVSRAKRSLKDLGESAKKAGQDAGTGIGAIGAGGDKAAKDVERATKNIQGQLQRAIASFDAGEKGSRKFYESLARQRGADVATLKPLLDQLDAYKSKSEAAAQASAKASTSFSGLGAAAAIAGRAVAAIGIATSVGEFIRLADASTNVASRLGLVTSSAAELANVQQRLFGIAQSSRVSFADLVGTYAQVARSTKDLGVSQNSLLGVIQTISQAVTISGGSAASAQAALVQLSQGFAAGALRGEELNSIMEQTPRLAQAIADGMGVSVGKLRELGQAGALTAEAVLGALEKSAAGVAVEFGKMSVTVEQASTNAANSVLRLVGAFDRLLGVTSAIGGAIQTISNGLDFLSADVEKLGNQGPLRAAAREVINLNAAAERLRTGMASGVLGPNAQAELDRINARLAEAKQRFRDLDKQLGGATDPRDQTGFTGRGESYANEEKRLAKLQEDANKFRLNQAGVPASYLKDMAELIRLNQAGVIVGKEYTDALKKQQDELLKKTGAVKSSNAAANQEQNAYESLIASIRAKIEADNLEIAGGAALTESQRIRIKLDQDLAAGRVKMSAQNERAVRLALEELAASEASALAAKTRAKANIEAAASREKYITSLATGLDKIRADIQAQEDATARMGLSKEAIADLDAAKLEMMATDLELQAIKAMDRNLDEQTYNALKQQAEAYRELAAAKKAGAAKEMKLDLVKADQEAAKKAKDEWGRAADDINRSLTDALLRGFESGKGFAKNLRDTVVNMFKTMVLRPVISAVLKPVSNTIGEVVSSGLSALGIGGQAASMAGLFGVGGGATAASFVQNVATGVSVGLSSSEAIAAATAAGQAMGASAGTGFMASLSAIPGWGWALGGLAALGGLFNGGETRSGASYAVDASGRAQKTEGPSGGEIAGPATRAAIEATSVTINGILKSLGSSALLNGFVAGLESSEKGKAFVFAGGRVGDNPFGESKGRASVENIGNATAEQAMAAFSLDLKQATIQALQAATDLPKSVRDQLANIDAEQLTSEAADQIIATLSAQAKSVTAFREAVATLPFESLKDLSYDAAVALDAAAGGLGNLAQSLTSFSNNTAYYTQAEIDARTRAQLQERFSAYSVDMPKTTAEYRALVEQIAALAPSSELAAKGLAELLANADAFARISTSPSSSSSSSVNSSSTSELASFQARFSAYNVEAPNNMFEYRALMAQAAAAAPNDANAAKGLAELEANIGEASRLFTQAAQDAATNWGPSYQNASDGGGSAAEKIAATWKSATDSIKSTMDDLRKTLIDETKPSLAALQAEFAVAVAQAKAGDATAAASLPDIAKAISAAGRERASSALEAALITARAAQALQDVLDARRVASAAPSYMGLEGKAAVFPDYERRPTWLSQPEIDENMRYAQVSHQHLLDWYFPWMQSQSPELLPPDRASAPNPVMEPDRMYIFSNGPGGNGPGGNATEIADALAAMAERLAAIEAATRATQNATRSTADVLERASRGSQPLTTQVTA